MAEPFDVPLPTTGQKPWSLNPAIEEVRGRVGDVEDYVSGPGIQDAIAEAVASVEVVDGTVANLFSSPTSETNTALVDQIGDSATPIGAELSATIAGAVASVERAGKTGQGWWDYVFAPPATEDIPTITVLSTAPTGTLFRETRVGDDSTPVDIDADPHFLFTGGPAPEPASTAEFVRPQLLPENTTTVGNARYMQDVEWVTPLDNATVAIRVRTGGTSGTFRLWVDGKPLSLTAQSIDFPSGAVRYIRLDFPTARARRIKWRNHGTTMSFGGIILPAGIPERPESGLRVAVVGASFVAGSGSAPDGALRMETYAGMLADLLGARDFRNFGVGGTGWINSLVFGPRVSAAVEQNPDVLIIEGSRNDSNDPAAIYSAAKEALEVAASVPHVYVIGPATTPYAARANAIRKACLEAGRQFIDPAAQGWLRPEDIGSDGIHPTFEGHKRYARLAYAAIGPLSAVASTSPLTPTTVDVVASPTTATAGGSFTVTATVTAGVAGTVRFRTGTTTLADIPVSGGTASTTVSGLAVGAYTITVLFMPEAGYSPSTSSVNITVTPAPEFTLTPITSDSFSGTEVDNITGRMSDAALGGTSAQWNPGVSNTGSGTGAVVAGEMRRGATSTGTSLNGFTTTVADTLQEITVRGVASPSSLIMLSARRNQRAANSTLNAYMLSISASEQRIRLYKVVAGVTEYLSDYVSIADGDRIGLLVWGSKIRAYKNGLVVAEATDTSIATSAWAGVYVNSGTDSYRVDDYKLSSVTAV